MGGGVPAAVGRVAWLPHHRPIPLPQPGQAGVPAKRIVRTSGLALLGMLVLAGALLLPALVTEEGMFRIDPQTREVTVQAQVQTPETPAAMERPQWLDQLGQGSSFQFPPFLNYLLWA